MVKNLSADAGDTGLMPGPGTNIPYASGQKSLFTTTTESTHSRAHVPQQEKPVHTARESPHMATKTRKSRQSACQKGQWEHTAKIK